MVDTQQGPIVGARYPKVDGVAKVTGAAVFGADVSLPGMLHARVLRSPYAHARILRIDTSKAEALPGVGAVCTGADFPDVASLSSARTGEVDISLKYLSSLVVARDKALFQGHPVAAVAAITPEIAEQALGLIEVEYEALPPVLDPVESMAEDAPLLHEDLRTSSLGGKSDTPSNVALHVELGRGDVEKGFAESDVVVELEFRTSLVHQGYLEPDAETAFVAPDGHVSVWADTQGVFDHRAQLAQLLDIPEGDITVTGVEVGGAFGGKAQTRLSPLCVVLSRKSGRPVQLVLSRAEVLRATGPGAGAVAKAKLGVTRDGRMKAYQSTMIYNAGAFPGAPVSIGCLCSFAPYQPESLKIDGYDVVTNTPRVAAYRAPGATVGSYIAESVVDEAARRIGMDPLEFRIRNASKTGDRNHNDMEFTRLGIVEMLETAAKHPAWTAPLGGPNRGRGVALGWWPNGVGASSCRMTVEPDGSVSLVVGSMDLSSTRTGFVQLAADALGLAPEDVHLSTADTDGIAYTGTSGGSRVTRSMSAAIHDASQSVIEQVKERIAPEMGVEPGYVDFARGVFSVRDDPDRKMRFKEAAARSVGGARNIVASATNNPNLRPANGYALAIADVEVDPETGKTNLLKFTLFQDVGQVVNPDGVEGQMQGGAAQGIGWALSEEYVFAADGTMMNPSFLDYRMPTALDLPMIETVILETPADDGPYGIRGVGEPPIVPPPGALANAVRDATGIRITELPLSPPRVLRAIQQHAG